MPDAASSALITDDAAILGLLAATLGAVFWTASRESGFWSRFYNYVPAILMCYLVPAIYNSIGLIDGGASNLYPMARDYLLPASLVLFCIAMDIGAILRLGPKAVIMFLTGTVGVMLGAVVRSEEHTYELQSLMRISYAVFCLKKKKHNNKLRTT